MILAFHKPYGVLSQFTPDGSPNRTLAEFRFPPEVYPVGRLDADSEGLLLLTDEPEWNERLLHPRRGHVRRYWAQVERIPEEAALKRLERGVVLRGERTRPCRAWVLDPQPAVEPRVPPIRFRKSVDDCWIVLELSEGRNRQVRRMTAAIGHPTLRLVRVAIGGYQLGDLPAGRWVTLAAEDRNRILERRGLRKPDDDSVGFEAEADVREPGSGTGPMAED
jgi:23S rRNA pseudouridine2457 synthase